MYSLVLLFFAQTQFLKKVLLIKRLAVWVSEIAFAGHYKAKINTKSLLRREKRQSRLYYDERTLLLRAAKLLLIMEENLGSYCVDVHICIYTYNKNCCRLQREILILRLYCF